MRDRHVCVKGGREERQWPSDRLIGEAGWRETSRGYEFRCFRQHDRVTKRRARRETPFLFLSLNTATNLDTSLRALLRGQSSSSLSSLRHLSRSRGEDQLDVCRAGHVSCSTTTFEATHMHDGHTMVSSQPPQQKQAAKKQNKIESLRLMRP